MKYGKKLKLHKNIVTTHYDTLMIEDRFVWFCLSRHMFTTYTNIKIKCVRETEEHFIHSYDFYFNVHVNNFSVEFAHYCEYEWKDSGF